MRHFCLFVLAGCAATMSARAQDTLSWRFQPGETLKYTVQQTMNTHMEDGANAADTTMKQAMDMSWKVTDVTSDGNAKIDQQIDRVRLSMEGGVFGTGAEFDSADSGAPSNPIVKAMSDVFRQIIGQPFEVTMNTTGKVVEVEVPPALLKSLTASGAGVSNVLSEDALKQMMSQSSVTLPEGAVSRNQTWETAQRVELPFGAMKVDSRMTYLGPDPETGLAKIAMQPSVSVEPKKDSPLQLKLTNTSGNGTILFDRQNGRIVRSELSLQLEMEITQFGRSMTQNVQQQTVMQLTQ